jgi:hypothetical protein
MRALPLVSSILVFGVLLAGMPAYTGVATQIDRMNPHVYIYIDEKGEDGNVVTGALSVIRRTAFSVTKRREWARE